MVSPALAEAQRIVVTGIGLSTSLGFGAERNWERLLAGESAIRSHAAERFPPPVTLPTRLGAAMDREALAERIRKAVPRTVWNTSAEVCHLWLLTASRISAAGIRQTLAQASVGVPGVELFPKSDHHTGTGFGSLVRYPLFGKSRFLEFRPDGDRELRPNKVLNHEVWNTVGMLGDSTV